MTDMTGNRNNFLKILLYDGNVLRFVKQRYYDANVMDTLIEGLKIGKEKVILMKLQNFGSENEFA